MGIFSDIFTIARWEVKKSFSTMGRNVLPLAIILFILLILTTGFVARSGMHLQDGMYTIATDDRDLGNVLASDGRFTVFVGEGNALVSERSAFDLIIVNGTVSQPFTDRGRAALTTLSRDYSQYLTSVYSREPDLFAAYPLWIDLQYVKSELDFQATQSGQYISVRQRPQEAPEPQGPVVQVTPPPAAIPYSADELRKNLQQDTGQNDQIARYTNLFTQQPSYSSFKTPSQLSPTLPFDSIIFVFVFIFPLYFTSQFFMMSIMNERIRAEGGDPPLEPPASPRHHRGEDAPLSCGHARHLRRGDPRGPRLAPHPPPPHAGDPLLPRLRPPHRDARTFLQGALLHLHLLLDRRHLVPLLPLHLRERPCRLARLAPHPHHPPAAGHGVLGRLTTSTPPRSSG